MRSDAIRYILAVLAVTAAMMSPALIIDPIIYPDSVGYYHAGLSAISEALRVLRPLGDSGSAKHAMPHIRHVAESLQLARSLYYGLTYVVLAEVGRTWGLVFAQAFVSALVVLRSVRLVRATGEHLGFDVFLSVLIALFTGIGWFSMAAMPDIFAGLSIVAIVNLACFRNRMSRYEVWAWLVLLLFGCLAHKSILAVSAGVLTIWFLIAWRKDYQAKLSVAAVLVIATVGHFLVGVIVERVTGHEAIVPPFTLARLIGDGTAVDYLREACPSHHFETCKYLNHMPMSENTFLWSHNPSRGVIGIASPVEREAISNEASSIVEGTLSRFPLRQFEISVSNSLKQFATVGVTEYQLGPLNPSADTTPLRSEFISYYHSALETNPAILIDATETMEATYWLLILVLLALSLMLGVARLPAPSANKVLAALLLIAGVSLNAAICGAVSGVFDRYQGRVAWLIALTIIALFQHLYRRQSLE